jgi:nicotinamide riboside kinase
MSFRGGLYLMKIAFMGTQGTGKSTLLELFLKDNPNYTRSINMQRILKTKFNIGINTEASFNSQYALSAHYATEVNAHKDYIADRSVIDTFVYAKASNNITSVELKYIEEIFEKAVEDYDIIFYLPIEFIPPEDGLRVIDLEYRNLINSLMEEYKEKHYHKIITLKGTIEERYTKMISFIS